ncbi:hypothetical protein [Clostridium sp. D53t1_180928_C8]|uniref:hypothetical protein n=1 Tax=Clostridium sp. D53t1_180928_C8 TaxID=2787101 RepID=UPI001FACBAEE|nr:hypothetical protein [Clostridium sp. D53t1_180928_C8]
MIINRHGSFDVKEIKRILKTNGIFVTQQVGGKNNEVLSKKLIKDFEPLYEDNTLDNNLKNLKDNSFKILYAKEYYPYLRFKDIGAIVYFSKIIKWEFPDFSVESCFEELCRLNEEIAVKGYIESIEHRYILVCRKHK